MVLGNKSHSNRQRQLTVLSNSPAFSSKVPANVTTKLDPSPFCKTIKTATIECTFIPRESWNLSSYFFFLSFGSHDKHFGSWMVEFQFLANGSRIACDEQFFQMIDHKFIHTCNRQDINYQWLLQGEKDSKEARGTRLPWSSPLSKTTKGLQDKPPCLKKKAKIQMENDVCCLCRVHVPLGPREERVIWESCLHASTFFKIASSTPE